MRRDQDFCNRQEKRFTLTRLRSQKTGTMSDDMMPDANTGLRGRAGYAQGWQDHRQ